MSALDDDVDFRMVQALCLRRWKAFVATVVLGTAAAAALIILQPRQYEAAVSLVLSGQPAPVGSSNAASVRTLLTTPGILEEAARDAHAATLRPEDIFVDPVPHTTFVRLRVRQPDPALAERVMQALAERGAELSRRVQAEPFEPAPDSVDFRVSAARKALENAEATLLEFRSHSRIEVLRRDIETELEHRATAQSLGVEIDRERARLSAAAAAIERLKAGRAGERTAAASAPDSGQPEVLLDALASTLAQSQTRLAELERTQSGLAKRLKADPAQPLQELYKRELELKRLEQDYEIARQTYTAEMVRARQDAAPAAPAVPMIHILEKSSAPAKPVPQERIRVIALAVVLSFLIAPAVVVAIELVALRRRRIQAARV